MKRERLTHAILLAALLALNVAVKYTLWIQTPQTFPDSVGYTAPAMSLLDGLGYGAQVNGFRPPTYPLFIAAILLPFDHTDLSSCRHARDPACLGEAQHAPGAQRNLQAIVFVQILLGMAILPMVCWFAWRIARNPWAAALCAATYAIDLSTAYWEISILSETLTTFLVTLVVCLTLLADSLTRHRRLVYLALGLALGATTLVRPNFFLFALVPSAFLMARAARERSLPSLARAVVEVAPVFLLPAFLVLAWSARNYFVDGYFTVSTLTGYNLTQMTGGFMEKAPPQYRDLAEIYLEYRPERIEKRGSHTGTVFFAYKDMLAERGITWAALSQELTQMTVQMILEHPGDYLKNSLGGLSALLAVQPGQAELPVAGVVPVGQMVLGQPIAVGVRDPVFPDAARSRVAAPSACRESESDLDLVCACDGVVRRVGLHPFWL